MIDVENDDLRLRPGMTATTTIVFAEKSDVLAIPNSAMRFKPPTEVASAIASSALPAASLSVTAAGAAPPAGKLARKPAGEGTDSHSRTLYVLRDGRPAVVEVKTGLSDGTVTEVASGDLAEGDLVILEANVAGKPASSGSPARMGRMF